MADSNALAALLSAGIGGPEVSDLNQFGTIAAANSPYRMAAAPILGTRLDTSSMGTGGAIGTVAAQAFLGSLLNSLGARNEAAQVAQVSKVLPSLYADPAAIAAPEGVDPEAFQQLRANSILRREAAGASSANKIFEGLLSAKVAGEKAKQEVLGKQAAYGIDGTLDPESPQFKIEQQKKELEQGYTKELLTGTAAQRALQVNSAVQSIATALKKDSPLAATTAIYKFAKTIDPTGAVRDTDSRMVADPGGPLGQLAMLHNEILQKGKLTIEAKKAMAELLPSLVDAEFGSYNQVKDNYLTAAKDYGAKPERVKYLQPFDIVSGLLPSPKEVGAVGFRDAAKALNLTREQANNYWLKLGGE